jgi:hypothetical protein
LSVQKNVRKGDPTPAYSPVSDRRRLTTSFFKAKKEIHPNRRGAELAYCSYHLALGIDGKLRHGRASSLNESVVSSMIACHWECSASNASSTTTATLAMAMAIATLIWSKLRLNEGERYF